MFEWESMSLEHQQRIINQYNQQNEENSFIEYARKNHDVIFLDTPKIRIKKTIEINNMSGEEFEDYCIRILKRIEFDSCKKTKRSYDYGADIIAMKNNIKYAFQCKRYEQSVGISAIQEVYSSKNYYNCDECGVITNSVFTDAAYRLSQKLNIILIDKNLLKIIL